MLQVNPRARVPFDSPGMIAVNCDAGRSIQVRRMAIGLTRTDLARGLGLPVSFVVDLEKGREEISTEMLALLTECLLVSVESLFDGSYHWPGPSGRDWHRSR